MKLSMVLMCIATLLLVGTVNAATKEKDMEIDALGAYTMLSGADGGPDISAFFLMGRGGYFVTKEIQVSAVLLGAYLDTGAADNTTLYAAGVAGKYHFMTDQKGVPYVGAQFLYGVADLGTSANGTIYGALVGYRYEMTPTTDLFVEGQYNFISGDLGDAVDNMIGVFVGLIHKWQ